MNARRTRLPPIARNGTLKYFCFSLFNSIDERNDRGSDSFGFAGECERIDGGSFKSDFRGVVARVFVASDVFRVFFGIFAVERIRCAALRLFSLSLLHPTTRFHEAADSKRAAGRFVLFVDIPSGATPRMEAERGRTLSSDWLQRGDRTYLIR